MKKDDLLALGCLILGISGIVLYAYSTGIFKLLGETAFLFSVSLVIYYVDFRTIGSIPLGYLLALISLGLTIAVYVFLFNKVSYFREYGIVFAVTLGRVIPTVIAAVIRVLLGIND